MSGFEIVGLVVTLGEIATLGVKTATKLHELHENVTKSLQDAKRLRLQVDAIVRLLNQVKEQLDRSAAVASKQQLLRDVSVPAQSCEAVLREILHSASIALSDSLRDTIWRRTKYAVFTLPQHKENHQQIVDLFESMRHVVSAEQFMDQLRRLEPTNLDDQRDSSTFTVPREPSSGNPSHRTQMQQEIEERSLPTPDTSNSRVGDNSAFVHVPRNMQVTTSEASRTNERQGPNVVDDRRKYDSEPVPDFTMWLAKPCSKVDEPWMILLAPISDKSIARFLRENVHCHLDIHRFDIRLMTLIFERIQAHNAQLVAIKEVMDGRELRRFFSPKLLSVDFATKPVDANEQLMLQHLATRAPYTSSTYEDLNFPDIPPATLPQSMRGHPSSSSKRSHSRSRSGSSTHFTGANRASEFSVPTNLMILIRSSNAMLQALLDHVYVLEVEDGHVREAISPAAPKTITILQLLSDRWHITPEDLQEAGNVRHEEIDKIAREMTIKGWLLPESDRKIRLGAKKRISAGMQ